MFIHGLQADEVILYDLDFSQSELPLLSPLPITHGPYPGRTTATELTSSAHALATIVSDPSQSTQKAVLLDDRGSLTAELTFSLFAGGVYFFDSHRIEAHLQIANPEEFLDGDYLCLFTDSGVFNRLFLRADRSATISVARASDGISPVQYDLEQLGTFNPAEPIHLIVETDATQGTAVVNLNGQSYSFQNLVNSTYGFRNFDEIKGPILTKLILKDLGRNADLLIRSFQISATDYSGPLIRPADEVTVGGDENSVFGYETNLVTMPIEAPDSGTWRPEFSHDTITWQPFGGQFSAEDLADHVATFGSQASEQFFLRFAEVTE